MMFDILVGSSIAVAAGVHAFLVNAQSLGVVLLVVSFLQISTVFVFLLVAKWFGERGFAKLVGRLPIPSWIRGGLLDGSEEMRQIVNLTFSGKSLSMLACLLMMTFIVMTVPALILYVMLGCSGGLCFANALLAFHSGNALGVLPITVGGAGLTEAGVYLYLNNVLKTSVALTVMQWRIATYYISTIIAAMLLILTAKTGG